MDRSLPGMTPADYHVAGSIRLNEAATAAYSRALAYWKSFRKKFDALPASDTGTTLTRDEWLLPLFDCLGYGRLQTKRAISIDSKDYPISHGWEDHVPIHLLSARLPLDKRTQNVSGAATRSPYSLVQELLNRSSKHRWGFVSNGLKFYVLRDNASLTRSANVEFDLETMMDGEYHADFTALFLTCHQSRLEIQPTPIVDNKGSAKKASKPAKTTKTKRKSDDDDADDDSFLDLEGDDEAIEIEEPTRLGPENCWLEAWTKLAGEQGTRARERLRDGVQLAIQTFGAGFYTCPSNAALHHRLRSGELSTQDYYRQLLRLVYRLLMLMVAEDKRTESGQNLLHPIDTPAHIRDRYAKFYGIARIRKLAYERRGTPHRDLYESLKTTFLKLREGYSPLGIPGIGSFLFSDTATSDLDDAQITNEALLDAFRNLCFTEDTTGRGAGVRRAVDFGNLGSEELGSIYESLLELHPAIDSEEGPFVLRTAAGNERKTSGSYYTPTSLINCLLDSALDPVVNQAIDVPDREEAKRRLLDLKVCDPACGSGHFLIAAANRMALHLARLETQDTEPTTLQIQHAKRQIIGRCIYGVDINEMAVELCKVSLWMEALEPGKPFSFLENHIKCGNSLLGATPRLLNEGIPDEAFIPIEGDDKSTCSQLKKDNKRERVEFKSGQGYLFEPFYKLGNMADSFARLSAADDESLDAIADKQKQYDELIKGTPYLNARFWADCWCAAFVWKKDDTEIGRLCPTERKYREIERHPHSASQMIREEVQKLARQYQFHHWHLAFPDVFVLPEKTSTAENEQTGWNAGFDVVLGNPPWERVKLQVKEWFATKRPEIALARNAAIRMRLVEQLRELEPTLHAEFQQTARVSEATSMFCRVAGRFPLCGKGDVNTYTLFSELNTTIQNSFGCSGFIVPTGIATDELAKDFFSSLVTQLRLSRLISFENEEHVFVGVHNQFKFCLVTVTGADRPSTSADLLFFARQVSDISNAMRHFALTPADFSLLNPNTRTCPTFRTAKDAELNKFVYGRHPVLCNDRQSDGDPWKVRFLRMFDMASDSGRFRTVHQLGSEYLLERDNKAGSEPEVPTEEKFIPLIEAKMVHILDHRFGTYENATQAHLNKGNLPRLDSESHANPRKLALPQYWVSESEVASRMGEWKRRWALGWRNISRSVDERTIISCILPWCGVNNSFPLFVPDNLEAYDASFLVTSLCSFLFDYLARQKIGGSNVTYGYVKQLPVLSPKTVSSELPFGSSRKTGDWVASSAIELIYTSWDLESFAFDAGFNGPPFRWDDDRRFKIRCELDAAFFHFYLGTKNEWGMLNGNAKSEGVNKTLLEMFATPRDAVSYVMDTFPIVRRKDEANHGEYRTKRVILEIYDRMTEIIETNEAIRAANPGKSEEELRPLLRSYQSPLNPPPGPPTDANGNFIPYADWTDEIHRQYAGVIHPQRDADQVSTMLKNSAQREGDNG